MTGNVGLDVVIGLVFVYLLYSLYATIIMEIFSSSFGLRARNLSYAIKRMLMDERRYDKYYLSNPRLGKKIERLFRWLSELIGTFIQPVGVAVNLKNKGLYKEFFNQPSIRTLCSGSLSNLPSYIPAETFSKALIDSIRDDDPDLSVIASVHVGLENKNLLPDNSETKKLIQSLLRDANNDLVKFQLLLERWYNDTMERSRGWFKRTTQIMLAAIGFSLAIAFNVDSIAIIKRLSNDKEARAQMVNLATQFNDKNAATIESVKALKDTGAVADLNRRLTSLDTIRKSLEMDINNSKNILASDWHLPNLIRGDSNKRSMIHTDSIQLAYATTKDNSANQDVFFVVHKSIDHNLFRESLPNEIDNQNAIIVNTAYYKFWYAFNHIWGYLLTVLAISLGAPFWFDLLNKLVKLRTSQPVGTTSEQSNIATKVSPAAAKATLNRAG
jgi:hypothetical protein